MAVLFKQPNNILRTVQGLDSIRISTGDQTNSNAKIPLVFGTSLITPKTILKVQGPETYVNFRYPEVKTEIVFYALSPKRPAFTFDLNALYDQLGRVYINGRLVEKIYSQRFFSNTNPTTNISNPNVWRRDNGMTQYVGSVYYDSGFNPNGGQFDGLIKNTPLVMQYLETGRDWYTSLFWQYFGPESSVGDTQDPSLRILKEMPADNGYDMLAVFYKYDPRVYPDEDVLLQLEYTRHPIVPDGSSYGFGRRVPKSGNCILEVLTDNVYGLNLDSSKYALSDFTDVGTTIAGDFSVTDTPLFDIVTQIEQEHPTFKVYRTEDKIRYLPENSTGLSINEDNIIGDFEVQFPDSSTVPTQLNATYNSFERGAVTITIGNDDSNVLNVNITTATDLANATSIAEDMFERLQNTISIKFTADKSFNQFAVNDLIAVSTNTFSVSSMRIVEMNMNDDYTFSVTGEALTTDTLPSRVLPGGITPVIETRTSFYRPDVQERTVDPDADPDPFVPATPAPITPPGDIEPPTPGYHTISVLTKPYNHVTGTTNSDWYLGCTEDNSTPTDEFDINGCRTRLVQLNGSTSAGYNTSFSLVYRKQNVELPTAVLPTFDIDEVLAEQEQNLVGYQYFRNRLRVHYQGFWNDRLDRFRTTSNGSINWTVQSQSWPANENIVMYGGTKDPRQDQGNTLANVYKVEADYLGTSTGRYRFLHTYDTDNWPFNVIRNTNYVSAFENQRRSGAIRIHFTAIYGSDVRRPTRVEYIGSTTSWADGRSILPADVAEATTTRALVGARFTETYTAAPSRLIS